MGTALRQIRTWLNEKEYQAYIKNAEKMHLTEYAVTKKLALDFLEKRREQNKKFLTLYFFMCYSLVATAIILLLMF